MNYSNYINSIPRNYLLEKYISENDPVKYINNCTERGFILLEKFNMVNKKYLYQYLDYFFKINPNYQLYGIINNEVKTENNAIIFSFKFCYNNLIIKELVSFKDGFDIYGEPIFNDEERKLFNKVKQLKNSIEIENKILWYNIMNPEAIFIDFLKSERIKSERIKNGFELSYDLKFKLEDNIKFIKS